jgi:hypothetical protein
LAGSYDTGRSPGAVDESTSCFRITALRSPLSNTWSRFRRLRLASSIPNVRHTTKKELRDWIAKRDKELGRTPSNEKEKKVVKKRKKKH